MKKHLDFALILAGILYVLCLSPAITEGWFDKSWTKAIAPRIGPYLWAGIYTGSILTLVYIVGNMILFFGHLRQARR